MNSSRRVVITGVGVVSPLGGVAERDGSVDNLVDRLRSGKSGVRTLTQIPTGVLPISAGGEAIEFTGDISDYGPMDKKLQRTIRKGSKVMCREIEMGVAVAQLALNDAGLDSEHRDPERTGVIYGCDYIISRPEEYAAGIAKCMDSEGKFHFEKWGQLGRPEINPLWLLKYLPNMPASHIAIYNDLRGPNNSITIREASGCAAVGEALSTISRGHADVLVVGSTGSRIHPLRTLHAALQEDLASDCDDPSKMSRPFDASRDGAVVSEGAGAMVLETLEHAQARGATILGEVVHSAGSAVGPSNHLPNRGGYVQTALTNVYRKVLGGADPASIGHIHAHGIASVYGDAAESAAIAAVFGDPAEQPPVTTLKGHMGNLGGGSGMVEIIASLLSLGQTLFPIRNLNELGGDCPVNPCRGNSTPAGDSFVSANITPQGQSAAVMIRRWSP